MTELELFFDWLRNKQANKKLTQTMVDGVNELLALMSIEDLKESLQKINGWDDNTVNKALSFSQKGIEMLCDFEGFEPAPYLDAVKKPTIGYGTTYYVNADGTRTNVSMKDKPITNAQALAIKQNVINHDFAPAVNLMFADEIASGKIKQNQFDALISLAYNIGIKGLKGSSIYRYIKQGNFKAAADAFLAWNKGRVSGKLVVLGGLSKRRAKEREWFLA